jgi:hypothetical protein
VKKIKYTQIFLILITAALLFVLLPGCGKGGLSGYQGGWLYPQQVKTVYVEMFDTDSFYRGHEYVLTDAICKRIESETPYKIVSNRDYADSVLSGRLGAVRQSVLARDRFTGRPLEREVSVLVTVNWKDVRNGDLLINSERVSGTSSFSPYLEQSQTFDYAADVAVNKAAVRVVELMQKPW